MDEFQTVVDDISAWQRAGLISTDDTDRPDDAQCVKPLSGQFQAELLNVSIAICVAASIANVLERRSQKFLSASDILDFCPAHSTFFTDTIERVLCATATTSIREDLMDYVARLQFAQTLTRHLKSKTAANGNEIDIEILSDAWRHACRAILRLYVCIDELVGHAGDRGTRDRSAWIIAVLTKVQAGEAPWIDAEGHVEIPGWAERRREKRIKTHKLVRAMIGGRIQEVTILNASARGLGLIGKAETGQFVSVLLADGRIICGSVVWANEDRFGLRLDVSLSASDPLLIL